MDLDNPAADVPGLGIPGDVIADFEGFSIAFSLTRNGANRVEHAALTAMAMQTAWANIPPKANRTSQH